MKISMNERNHEAELLSSTYHKNKTDWAGYAQLTAAALFLAYIIAHVVVGLNRMVV